MITAVIPVRAGSKRLPNKNILPFGKSNLLIHKIEQLKQVNGVDKIIVSSDSEEMLKMAESCGVGIQKRPLEYCDEKSKSFNEVIEYIASNVSGEILMITPCVCPLIAPSDYKKAILEFLDSTSDFDSVISVKLVKEYLFNENGALNFSIKNHVPSQKLPEWFSVINGFYIARRLDMIKWRFVYGERPKLVDIDKRAAVDIDDIVDYEMARFLYEKYNVES